jgi:outer membrane lipoprotein-sorting protein
MKSIARLAFQCLLAGVTAPLLCQEVPKTMTKISAARMEHDSASFAAQPKILWRAGTKYARIAESPDLQNHIQGLIIIREPDAWMLNLSGKSGKHIVDSGPSLVVRLPIFDRHTGIKSKLNELEFGMELDFFARNNATHSAGVVIEGNPTDRYDVAISDAKLILWTDAKSKKPLRVSLIDGKQSQAYQYLFYDDNLPFDPSLFQPPDGISIEEPK